MPIDYKKYPPNWWDFRVRILARAALRCECTGQCGLHGGKHAGHRCTERHHQPARWARGRIVLTLAHQCSCDPICANPAHVIAACQRCHLRIDRWKHAAAAKLTRRRNGEGGGTRKGLGGVTRQPGRGGERGSASKASSADATFSSPGQLEITSSSRECTIFGAIGFETHPENTHNVL